MEVFSSPGWIKGNSLTLFVEQVVADEGARELMFFSRDRCHAPTLTINFNANRKVCQEYVPVSEHQFPFVAAFLFASYQSILCRHVLPTDVYDKPTHAFPPLAEVPTPESQPAVSRAAPEATNPNEDDGRSQTNPSAESRITRTEVTIFLVVLFVVAAAIFGAYVLFKRYKKMSAEKQAFIALQTLTDVNSEDSDDELVALQN
jgi:hypothetical protein